MTADASSERSPLRDEESPSFNPVRRSSGRMLSAQSNLRRLSKRRFGSGSEGSAQEQEKPSIRSEDGLTQDTQDHDVSHESLQDERQGNPCSDSSQEVSAELQIEEPVQMEICDGAGEGKCLKDDMNSGSGQEGFSEDEASQSVEGRDALEGESSENLSES